MDGDAATASAVATMVGSTSASTATPRAEKSIFGTLHCGNRDLDARATTARWSTRSSACGDRIVASIPPRCHGRGYAPPLSPTAAPAAGPAALPASGVGRVPGLAGRAADGDLAHQAPLVHAVVPFHLG